MWGMRTALALSVALLLSTLPAHAQLVDTPQNLMKAWQEAYASRTGEAMGRVYTRDALLLSSLSKEPIVGIDAIKQHFERTGQNVLERSATLTRLHSILRKRIMVVLGRVELKQKAKDGTIVNNQARFSMTLIRESRRQWSILGHHVSLVPQ